MLYGPLVTALTAWVLFRLLRELGASTSRALAITFTFAFGTLAWHYSTTIFSEPLVALGMTAPFTGFGFTSAMRGGAGSWPPGRQGP